MTRGSQELSLSDFRRALLRWHRRCRRDFPWRQAASPWHLLLVEMCLHRTRADQVVPVYKRLVRIGGSPRQFAKQSRAALAAMRSLGLRWRAKNVIRTAREIVKRHGGRVPTSPRDLEQLPGVGRYVAGAVASFGFGRRSVLVDTNTTRVVRRVFGRPPVPVLGRDRFSSWQMRLDTYALAGRRGPDAAFNYALLDLASLVCRPRAPLCDSCPVRDMCEYGLKRAIR